MAMENKEGECPRIGQTINYEMQYFEEDDGTILYKDCSCSELICCAEYDEEKCPEIWRNFFDSVYGTNTTAEEADPYSDVDGPLTEGSQSESDEAPE